MTYSEESGALKIWVNGKRFIARGGNWGFSESNLRYRSRELILQFVISQRNEFKYVAKLGGANRR
jgi:hypothetical protein